MSVPCFSSVSSFASLHVVVLYQHDSFGSTTTCGISAHLKWRLEKSREKGESWTKVLLYQHVLHESFSPFCFWFGPKRHHLDYLRGSLVLGCGLVDLKISIRDFGQLLISS